MEDAPTSAPSTIVITGMHRSGTSLVASAFQLAGLHIGDRLYGVGPGNRRGHFEDLDFQRFHEAVLARVGKSHVTVTPADVRELTAEDVERAERILAGRRERLWGWKDPRTCLFLDFWHARLTSPRYVFVYRHPLEVVLSMFRRGIDPELAEVVTDPMAGLEAWRVYNAAMLDFCRRHRDRCVLGHVGALAADLGAAVSLCARRFGVDLASGGASGVYRPDELARHAIAEEMLAEFARLAPSAAALYAQLEREADLPEPSPARVSCPDASERTETAAQRMDVLLTRLEPRAVLAGKWALDDLRRRQLDVAAGDRASSAAQVAAVEAHRAEVETRLAAAEGHRAELEARLAAAHEHRDEIEVQLVGARAQLAAVVAQRAGIERRLVATVGEATEARERIAGLQTELTAHAAQSSEQARTIAEKDRLLTAIAQTRVWRAAQRWYALKRAGLGLLGRGR